MINSKYPDSVIGEAARRDASANVPALGEVSPPPFLAGICAEGNREIQAVARKWHSEDTGLHAEWQRSIMALALARKNLNGPLKSLEEAQKTFFHERGVHPPELDMRLIALGALTTIIALLEVPLNTLAMCAFGSNEILTVVMAISVSLCFLLLAHFTALSIRTGHLAAAWVQGSLGVSVSLCLAFLRGLHYRRAEFAPIDHWMGAGLLSLLLVPLSIFLFLLGVAASYYLYDSLLLEVFRSKASVTRAEAQLRRQHAQFATAYANRSRRHAYHATMAQDVVETAKRRWGQYRTVKLRCRSDWDGISYPISFSQDPKMTIPECLMRLTWDPPVGMEETNLNRWSQRREGGYGPTIEIE